MLAKTSLAAYVAILVPGTLLGQSAPPSGAAPISVNPQPAVSTSGPWSATEVTKLTASDPMQSAYFGASAAISGNTLVIGAYGVQPNYGAAYTLVGSGATWTEQAKLEASNPLPVFAGFGSSAAISGDSVVVGVPFDGIPGDRKGSAYVFVRNGSAWTEQQELTASDGADLDEFGRAVSISDDTVIVGAKNHSLAGSVYVFVRSGTVWSEVQKLASSDAAAGDQFGASVVISGDTIVVGASHDDHGNKTDVGSAYVFTRGGANWSEQQKLMAGGVSQRGLLGSAIALADGTCLIGAPGEESAYVFAFDGSAWIEQQGLSAANQLGSDSFGYSVSVSGDLAVVGAYLDDHSGATSVGSAYLFARSGSVWIEQAKIVASDGSTTDYFGIATCVFGDTAVITSSADDHSSFNAGSAYVFQLSQSPSVSYCTAGTSTIGCVAKMDANGIPSATASVGFTVSAASVEGAKPGRFVFGTGGQQGIPWGNGTSFQCIVPPTQGGGLLVGSGTNGICDGSFSQDLNALWCATCPKPGHNPGAGTLVQAQLWYRDPASTSNQTTSLSDAIEFVVGP